MKGYIALFGSKRGVVKLLAMALKISARVEKCARELALQFGTLVWSA